MMSEQKKIGNDTNNKDKEIKDVKAFINKTRIQNETLKKIISRINKEKNNN